MAYLDNQDMVKFFTDYFGRVPTETDLIEISDVYQNYLKLEAYKDEHEGEEDEGLSGLIYTALLKKKVKDQISQIGSH